MTSDTARNIHSYSKYIYKCCRQSLRHKDCCWMKSFKTTMLRKSIVNLPLNQMCVEGETFLHNTVYLWACGILLLSASISTQSSRIPVWLRSTNWKSSLKEKNPTWTYMNTTARRIENLFQKSGIVFLHLPVITAQPPEAEGGNAQSPLLCHAFVN